MLRNVGLKLLACSPKLADGLAQLNLSLIKLFGGRLKVLLGLIKLSGQSLARGLGLAVAALEVGGALLSG